MSADTSWELTRTISPRRTVRVAAVDAYGSALNLYSAVRRVDKPRPDAPWAVNLADIDGQYRLIGFDFDAKTHDASEDADRLSEILQRLGIEHVVCESGPTNGRHVWLALTQGLSPQIVRDLAHIAQRLLPSLDVGPLTNAYTGCLRPPGAPHRAGGSSRVVGGDVRTLQTPTTQPEAITALVAALSALVVDTAPLPRHRAAPTHTDEHGHPYIPGPRRPLPAFSSRAANEPAALGDASAILWRVLIGAAAAHWHYHEVAALAETAPGLEHVRTIRDRSTRIPRPARGPASASATLTRQWLKAVQHVAGRAQRAGADPSFDPRADTIADQVHDIQTRARAVGGRWATRGGPADRRVLDALCLLALKSLSHTVEADIRRLALMTGMGRETARTALHRLAAHGWISQARDADGPNAAHWTLASPGGFHSDADTSRSQADPRPPGAGAAKRSAAITELEQRLQAAADDLFTLAPGYGLHAGNVFARLLSTPLPVDSIADSLGLTVEHVLPTLHALVSGGLVHHSSAGWSSRSDEVRREVARQLGVLGRLHTRALRYELERELWAWWQAEQTWMQAPRRTDSRRRPRPGQLILVPVEETNLFGAHPRRADGKADYRRARAILASGDGVGARPIQATVASTSRSRRRVA